MLVNGTDFKLYDLDTLDSVVTRIAAILNTSSTWLVIEPPLTDSLWLDNAKHYDVTNVLALVARQSTLKYPRNIALPEHVSQELAQRVFIATNTATTNMSVDNAVDVFKTIGKLDVDVRKAINDKNEIVESINKAIDETKAKYKKFIDEARAFDDAPYIAYTPHELSHVQFTIYIDDVPYELSEMYNFVTLNEMVPFAFYVSPRKETLYKIYRNAKIFTEWLTFDVPNVVLLKVNCSAANRPGKEWFYNAAFTIIKNANRQTLIGTFDMEIGPKYIDRSTLIDRVLSRFVNRSNRAFLLSADRRTKENVNVAYFSYPRQCLDVDVFADLAMNDRLFSATIAIDEFMRAFKTKQNVYVHVVQSNETCSMQMKRTLKYNDYGIKEIGTPYIRCRLRTSTNERIEHCQKLLGKLLYKYNANRDDVIAIYRMYIPSFLVASTDCGGGVVEPVRVSPKRRAAKALSLRQIAPEIFVSKYSRKCLYRPTIINDDDAASVASNRQVMRFPIKGESTTRSYICKLKSHPFPGLRFNTLENKGAFPYIPCCYSKDQTNRSGSLYRRYFHDETIETNVQHIQDVYTTSKILPPGIIGTLPPRIRKMFDVLRFEPMFRYVRKGVGKSPMSSVECVLSATNRLPNTKAEIEAMLLEERARLAADASFALASKQELFNLSLDAILNKIKQSELRATEFVRMLELAYDCNVFVFVPGATYDGELYVPNHAKAYYKFKPTRDTILLYEHFGSESDEASYPQCELIVKTRVDDVHAQTTSFAPNDPLIVKLFALFRRITRSYVNFVQSPVMRVRKLPITNQFIDAYGKCRVIIVDYEGTSISVITDPIPPFLARPIESISRVAVGVAKDYCRRWNVRLVWQRVSDGEVRELGINFGVEGVILVLNGKPISGVAIKTDAEQYADVTSATFDRMYTFGTNRRVAKLMYKYAQYALSKYMNRNLLTRLTPADFNDFATTSVNVDATRTYSLKYTSSKFESVNDFYDNGTLLVNGYETLRRLIFMLDMFYRYHYNELVNYQTLIDIPNFYEDVDDFDTFSNQYIVNGKATMEKIISASDVDSYRVYTTVMPDKLQPYFYTNADVFGPSVYLAKNVTSLSNANDVYFVWKRSGVYSDAALDFDSIPVDERDHLQFTIYSYVDETNVVPIHRPSSDVDDGICLAYLYNAIPSYTVLLKLP